MTPSFTAFGDALAARGFVVGLADLFDGRTAAEPAEAKRLRGAPRREPMYKTLNRNIAELRPLAQDKTAGVGVVGFSMGGHWAVWLAQRPDLPIAATVLYYAARAGSFHASRSAFIAHYADHDRWVSQASRRRMESELLKAGCRYQAFDYPGTQHWFAETDRPLDYVASAAKLAFERTADHLNRSLRKR